MMIDERWLKASGIELSGVFVVDAIANDVVLN